MVLEQIQKYFEKQQWVYSINKDESDDSYVASFNYKINNTVFSLFCEIYPDNHFIKLFIYAPNLVTQEKMAEALYLLNYINSSRTGCVFVVVNDDQIRLQDFVKFTAEGVSDDALEYLFYSSFNLLYEYYPYILNLLISDTMAAEQIAMISAVKSNRLN